MPRLRQRSARLSPVHHTNRQDHRPASGKNIASKAHRAGVADRVDEAAVPKHLDVDWALITSEDERRRALELSLSPTAKQHEAHPRYLVQPGPGIGNLLSLGRLYAIHAMERFPRGQDVAASGRLVQGAQESAGPRVGPSGPHIGTAHRTGACAEAAVLCWRNHPHGQQALGRGENTPDTGNALPILAHQLARAVYDLLKRTTAFAIARVRRAEESSAGEPAGSRDIQGHAPASRGLPVLLGGVFARHGVHLGLRSLSRTG